MLWLADEGVVFRLIRLLLPTDRRANCGCASACVRDWVWVWVAIDGFGDAGRRGRDGWMESVSGS